MPDWTIIFPLGVWAGLVAWALVDAAREEQRRKEKDRLHTNFGSRYDRDRLP